VGSADIVRHPGVDRRRQRSRPTRPADAATPSEHVQPCHRQPRRHRLPASDDCRAAQHLPAGKSSALKHQS